MKAQREKTSFSSRMQRYDFSTDEACTRVRFGPMDDGEYVRHEDASLVELELAYAMNDIVNMRRELKKTYDLISYHAGQSRKFEALWSEAQRLLTISQPVAKDAGRHTLAFLINSLLERPV